MSGAGTPWTTQSLTGNLNIDGLLSGVKWNASSITYSNPDSASDYQVGYSGDVDADGIQVLNDGFGQINATQLVSLQSALDSMRFGGFAPGGAALAVEGFTNLTISAAAAGSGNGTIRVANATDWTTAYGYYPSSSVNAGDVFINNTNSSNASPDVGNYGWHTMLHELGHALGLKHGHEGIYTLPASVDSVEYSVMTYRSYVGGGTGGYTYRTYSAPQTFMQLDILALQTMYGANYATNSGNTVYTWNPSNGTTYIDGQVAIDPGGVGSAWRIFATLWDGNGTDTYDLSNFTTSVNLDLAPGGWSTIDPARRASLTLDNSQLAQGNIANALLFNGDTRSLIENANGGSAGDIISGNQANNTLIGNDGNDALYGLSGGDWLDGGNGNDILNGGTGSDLMFGGQGDDIFYVDDPYDVVSEPNGGGYDGIYASTSYQLPSGEIEALAGQGFANLTLIGNSWGQSITGNAGADRIDGLGGNDVLKGGSNADTFVFSTTPSGGNVDTIQDFSTAQDKIELSRAVFTALNAGSSLNASAFRTGTAALDADDRIIYNNTNGALLYDADGSGAISATQFATLGTGLALAASHFTIA